MKITVKAGQTLADIAVIYMGSMEALMALALANDMAVTDSLTAGQQIESVDIMRPDVARIFMAARSQPATEIGNDTEQNTPLGGIGYMAVGVDFIVS